MRLSLFFMNERLNAFMAAADMRAPHKVFVVRVDQDVPTLADLVATEPDSWPVLALLACMRRSAEGPTRAVAGVCDGALVIERWVREVSNGSLAIALRGTLTPIDDTYDMARLSGAEEGMWRAI